MKPSRFYTEMTTTEESKMSGLPGGPRNDFIPLIAKNGTALTQQERASIAKRKGLCLQCGVKTHTISVFKRAPLTNDHVHKGTCIKCNPTSVPTTVVQEWELRNPHVSPAVSEVLRNNKEHVLEACSRNGYVALGYHDSHRNDKEVVLAACSSNGNALKFASSQLQNNKEVVLAAVSPSPFRADEALGFASQQLRNDKEVVLAACSCCGKALRFASQILQNDKEVVLAACSQDGYALEFASDGLRADKAVVMAAVEFQPESLKFALAGLNQDKDCLVKAGLWDIDYVDKRANSKKAKIVLSTKFSLAAESSAHATRFAVELKEHPYIANSDFVVYSPNAFNKGTCDPQWTNKDWPCRGTYSSCQSLPEHKTGVPQAESCWRYSFRCHLKEALDWGGFMIQVVDYSLDFPLGAGQQIEEEIAQDLGIKIFRFFEPIPTSRTTTRNTYAKAVDSLVSAIKKWCKQCDDNKRLFECGRLSLR